MKGILFDLDGTLIDSMYIWTLLDRMYIEHKGLKYNPIIATKLKEVGLSDTIDVFSEIYGNSVDFSDFNDYIDEVMMKYYSNEFKLKNQIIEKLEDFKKQGFKMCITTITPMKYVTPLVKRLGLDQFMEFIITSDTINIDKNDERFFKYAIEKLGTTYEDTYIFDDATYALKIANQLNLKTIAVYDNSNKDDIEYLKQNNYLYIKDFTELKIKDGKILV